MVNPGMINQQNPRMGLPQMNPQQQSQPRPALMQNMQPMVNPNAIMGQQTNPQQQQVPGQQNSQLVPPPPPYPEPPPPYPGQSSNQNQVSKFFLTFFYYFFRCEFLSYFLNFIY